MPCNALPSPTEVAADWIASWKDGDPSNIGFLADCLTASFPEEEPELAWQTIISVMRAYPEADFYADEKTEAQTVCGVLAAGPVEDLLSFHGNRFIERFECEARQDRRAAWLLGGAWQFLMNDQIWKRVQDAADHSYWKRRPRS